MSSLNPERLEGPRLAERFPHLRSLDLSHCQRMIVHPKVRLALQSLRLHSGKASGIHPLLDDRKCCGESCVFLLQHCFGPLQLRAASGLSVFAQGLVADGVAVAMPAAERAAAAVVADGCQPRVAGLPKAPAQPQHAELRPD